MSASNASTRYSTKTALMAAAMTAGVLTFTSERGAVTARVTAGSAWGPGST